MKVFHNPARKLFLQIALFGFAILIGGKTTGNSQEKPNNIADWTFPFQPCVSKLSEASNIERTASDNGVTVQLMSSTGSFNSVDLFTKGVLWKSFLGSEFVSNYESTDKLLFVASKLGENDDKIALRAISKATGITIWQVDLPFTQELLIRRKDSNLVVFSDVFIAVLSIENGLKTWLIDNELGFGTDFFEDLDQERFERVQKSNLALIENEGIEKESISAVFADQDSLIFGDQHGNLNNYDIANSKKLWTMKAGGKITSITRSIDNTLLITSLDNFLYRISLKSGNLKWKRRLPFRITDRPLIEDQVAIIGNTGNDAIFFVRLDSGKILNQISLPETVYLTGNLLLVGDRLIVPTTDGVFLYSQNPCSN